MASPNFTIGGAACPPESVIAYAATVNLALTSTSGVDTVAWSIVGTSRASLAVPAISLAGSPLGATASFVAASDPGDGIGISYLVKCKVNGGTDSTGQVDPSLTKTAIVGVQSAAGNVPFSVGEELERSATHGWTETLNGSMALSSGNVPLVETFTASGTWTKPANAVSVDILLVGGGQPGGNGVAAANGGGGGGGASGGITLISLPASMVPSSLTVTPGAAQFFSHVDNGSFSIFSASSEPGANAVAVVGGAGGGLNDVLSGGGAAGDFGGTGVSGVSGGGGGGGTGVNGGRGGDGYFSGGAGGIRVAGVGHGGSGGLGYGAGGGGGGGDATGTNGGGGGGGGGGYGALALAVAGQNGNAGAGGGTAAPGIVIITTWRGP